MGAKNLRDRIKGALNPLRIGTPAPTFLWKRRAQGGFPVVSLCPSQALGSQRPDPPLPPLLACPADSSDNISLEP